VCLSLGDQELPVGVQQVREGEQIGKRFAERVLRERLPRGVELAARDERSNQPAQRVRQRSLERLNRAAGLCLGVGHRATPVVELRAHRGSEREADRRAPGPGISDRIAKRGRSGLEAVGAYEHVHRVVEGQRVRGLLGQQPPIPQRSLGQLARAPSRAAPDRELVGDLGQHEPLTRSTALLDLRRQAVHPLKDHRGGGHIDVCDRGQLRLKLEGQLAIILWHDREPGLKDLDGLARPQALQQRQRERVRRSRLLARVALALERLPEVLDRGRAAEAGLREAERTQRGGASFGSGRLGERPAKVRDGCLQRSTRERAVRRGAQPLHDRGVAARLDGKEMHSHLVRGTPRGGQHAGGVPVPLRPADRGQLRVDGGADDRVAELERHPWLQDVRGHERVRRGDGALVVECGQLGRVPQARPGAQHGHRGGKLASLAREA
jgi:hypothetical protein